MKKESKSKFVVNFIEICPLYYSNVIILSLIIVGLILATASIYTNYSKASLIFFAIYTCICLYLMNTRYIRVINILKPFKKVFKREILQTKIVHKKDSEVIKTEYKGVDIDSYEELL